MTFVSVDHYLYGTVEGLAASVSCHMVDCVSSMTALNKALIAIPKRAETRQVDELRATFVDSGIAEAMATADHQIAYGRRGTGKTHALRFIEGLAMERGGIAVYVDLRTVGSPEGLFAGQEISLTERTARLLRDLLHQVYDSVLAAVVEDDELLANRSLTNALDALLAAVSRVDVRGAVELEETTKASATDNRRRGLRASGGAAGLQVGARIGRDRSTAQEDQSRVTRSGTEQVALNFTDVAKALRDLADSLGTGRVWLILDEWVSVPTPVQPYLAEFLLRCVLPLQPFTLKIAAIEQQSEFDVVNPKTGDRIGLELGADIMASVDLDEFMVFEQASERARDFFMGLFFKHLKSGLDGDESVPGLNSPRDLIRIGFSDSRAFDELVRAAEGVPRDAINIASKAAMRASDGVITVPHIRAAARAWYQQDKEAALRSRPEAETLLSWIIDDVVRGKRARAFLVNRRDSRSDLLMSLYESRVLHLVRRGYSAQDQPGERYNVFSIDYGAYVDLISTKSGPQGLLVTENGEYVDVPTQDLRAIRRSILDLEAFERNLEE